MATSLEQHNKRIKTLEVDNLKLNKELCEMKHRLSVAEERTLTTFVEVVNIPVLSNENPMEITKKIHDFLKLPIRDEEVVKAYRANRRSTNKPLIIKYSSEFIRNRVIAAFQINKSLRTTSLGFSDDGIIYINEFLSKEKRALLYKAKLFKVENGFRYMWVKGGRIYLKKDENSSRYEIKGIDTFTDILSKLNN